MKPRFIKWDLLDSSGRDEALRRPRSTSQENAKVVMGIVSRVRRDGDKALAVLTQRLDGCRPPQLAVESGQFAAATGQCSDALLHAMQDARQRIQTFHSADIPQTKSVETVPGMHCEVRYQPIDSVGLYVPGGNTPLISTVLMLGVPAQLAGCEQIVLCTPPGRDGAVAPELLAAAALCGIDQVFAVGGAQAIAAMAYGTESIPACNKIFGPGNAWVTEAKQQVALDPEGAAIDMPAGPSEVMVLADSSADPIAVAWDLLSQAEHGPDSQVILLTDDAGFADKVSEALTGLAAGLPRADILESSLDAARIIITRDINTAVCIANGYAPEHLIVNTRDARRVAESARNAGSIFIGPWTPESLGDYCSGTNHVLPTYGWARAYGALAVADFMRRFTMQEATEEGLRRLGPTAEALATVEGLEAHRMAVHYRLNEASPA